MEALTLALFGGVLLCCVVFDFSLILALLAGLGLFVAYGLYKRFSLRQLAAMAFSGVKTAWTIIFMMVLIGMLTALWRACGTIPVIICYASGLIRPASFLLMCFLLNCAVSILTGTSFGTAATMGVICMTMGRAMGADPTLTGGAILAGAYFGDRCSPISTSALLVSTLTQTDLFRNIKAMWRTALLPLALSCLLYLLAGLSGGQGQGAVDVWALFGRGFSLSWLCVLPAAVVLLVSLFHVRVIVTLSMSLALAGVLCVAVQHVPLAELPLILLRGYRAADPELAAMVDGGGVLSMLNVVGILLISSCYAGLFRGTGLLDGAKGLIVRAGRKLTPYGAMLVTSAVASAIGCNQTLGIMLTHQLCGDLEDDPGRFALDLEDTAVVTAALIPWSIAGAVPLATVGAPTRGILAAFFLYLLPLTRWAAAALGRRKLQRRT